LIGARILGAAARILEAKKIDSLRAVPMVETMRGVQNSHLSKNSNIETISHNGSFFV
jgi:F0F1-type ATP synthase alpha subunit